MYVLPRQQSCVCLARTGEHEHEHCCDRRDAAPTTPASHTDPVSEVTPVLVLPPFPAQSLRVGKAAKQKLPPKKQPSAATGTSIETATKSTPSPNISSCADTTTSSSAFTTISSSCATTTTSSSCADDSDDEWYPESTCTLDDFLAGDKVEAMAREDKAWHGATVIKKTSRTVHVRFADGSGDAKYPACYLRPVE